MDKFLKGLKNIGTKAKDTVGDFFAPKGKNQGGVVVPDTRLRDVIRETPKATLDALQQSGQGSMRVYGGISNLLRAKDGRIPELKPETQFQKDLYGTDKPISPKSVGEEILGEGSKWAVPLGLFLGVADLIPGGGRVSRTAVQSIVKLKNAKDIAKVLKQQGIGKQLATGLSRSLAKADTLDKVTEILKTAKVPFQKAAKSAVATTKRVFDAVQDGAVATTRGAKELAVQTVPKAITSGTKAIGDGAKAVKNAITTIKNPMTVYRGEGGGIGNTTLVRGKYFADSQDFAGVFGDVKEERIPAGAKIFDLDKVKSGEIDIPHQLVVDLDGFTQFLLDNGVEYTKNTNTRGVEYVRLGKNKDKVLEDIASRFDKKSDFLQYRTTPEGQAETKNLNIELGDSDRAWNKVKNLNIDGTPKEVAPQVKQPGEIIGLDEINKDLLNIAQQEEQLIKSRQQTLSQGYKDYVDKNITPKQWQEIQNNLFKTDVRDDSKKINLYKKGADIALEFYTKNDVSIPYSDVFGNKPLYHGTKKGNIESIKNNGFDPKLDTSIKGGQESPNVMFASAKSGGGSDNFAGMYGSGPDGVVIKIEPKNPADIRVLQTNVTDEGYRFLEFGVEDKNTANNFIKKLSEKYDVWVKGPSPENEEVRILNLNKFKIVDDSSEAFGVVSGIEEDEEGNLTFNPTKAALGIAGFTAMKGGAGKDKGLQKIGDIIEQQKNTQKIPNIGSFLKGAAETGESQRKLVERLKAEDPKLEELLQGKYKRRSTAELQARADAIIMEDGVKAREMAMNGTDDLSVAVAMRLMKGMIADAKSTPKGPSQDAIYEKIGEIGQAAAKNLTEAGRSVQAASLFSNMTPEGLVKNIQAQIVKYNQELKDRKTIDTFFSGAKERPPLTPEQTGFIIDKMTEIGNMPDGETKNRAIYNLQDEISTWIPSSVIEKLVALRKAGLLTGLKTTGVNIASNLANQVLEKVKNVPASAVDTIVGLITGKREVVANMNLKESVKGFAEGISKGWDSFKTGYDSRRSLDKLDYRKVNFSKSPLGRAAQKYVDTIFGFLGAQDQPFYYSAFHSSLGNQAMAKAKTEGLKGKQAREFAQRLLENPTDDMTKNAVMDAETAVFQQDSWLSKQASGLQKMVGQIILPFSKTPANVALAMWNYGPGGIVSTVLKNIRKGKFDQRDFSMGIGKGIIGLIGLAVGAELYRQKNMTLTYPTSKREREQWRLEGKNTNMIKMGDKWRNVSVLGPIGNVAIIGGNIAQGVENTGSMWGGLTQGIAGFGSALTEQTFLQGIKDLVDAIDDPTREANAWASSLLGSVVPTIVADIARATDEYDRRSTNPIQRVRSRIPGVRQGLEPKVTTLGELATPGSFLTVMLDPTRPGIPQADRNDRVVRELRTLADAGYQVTPTLIGPTRGFESLTPEENTYVLEMVGRYSKNAIEKMMDNPSYAKLDAEQKARLINNAVQDGKVEARARSLVSLTRGLGKFDEQKLIEQLREEGFVTNEVQGFYQSLKRSGN